MADDTPDRTPPKNGTDPSHSAPTTTTPEQRGSLTVPGLDLRSVPGQLNPSKEAIKAFLDENPRPVPMATAPLGRSTSLLASAAKLSSKQTADSGFRKFAAQSVEWQEDAWAMYDLVGELRFVVDNLSSRSGRAHFYVGEVENSPIDTPRPTENADLQSVLSSVGRGQSGLARIIERLTANLKVPGEGWLVGIPDRVLPYQQEDEVHEGVRIARTAEGRANSASRVASPNSPKDGHPDTQPRPSASSSPNGREKVDRSAVRDSQRRSDANPTGGSGLEDYTWKMFSTLEVTFEINGQVTLDMGPSEEDKLRVSADDVYLVRVHKPHPALAWSADSATRASLPVLRELVGLTMHISAQVDSRLAGAGVLIVPESYSRAVKRSLGMADDDPDDPVTEGLMQAMLTPISDRSAASALVPLVLTVPDEAADKFRHITFDKGLDTQASSLREESIRRLALGLDCPPELLLGTNSMNHWGGWLMREDVIRAHVEPTLALICDALTTQFLRPVIKENFPDLDPSNYVVWYDVEHLIMRASTGQDAVTLYNLDELSGDTLRRANGFDDNDAPEQDDSTKKATEAVFEMVKQNPGLMRRPGVDVLVRQVKSLLDGNPLGAGDMVAQAAESEVEAQEIEEDAGVEIDSSGGEGGESSEEAAPDADGANAAPAASNAPAPRNAIGVDSSPTDRPNLALDSPAHEPSFSVTDSKDLNIRGSLSQRYDPQPAPPRQRPPSPQDSPELIALELANAEDDVLDLTGE